MVNCALGLIEVVGLAAGIEAADAAVKAANVQLLGYELTKGGGLVVVKVYGDVGAVTAAVEAAAAAAGKVNTVYSTHVIPRPHSELSGLVETKDTVGYKKESPVGPKSAAVTAAEEQPVFQEVKVPVTERVEQYPEPQEEDPEIEENRLETVGDIEEHPFVPAPAERRKRAGEVCNLCGDPKCPRKKGDPKVTCLHYEKDNKEDE